MSLDIASIDTISEINMVWRSFFKLIKSRRKNNIIKIDTAISSVNKSNMRHLQNYNIHTKKEHYSLILRDDSTCLTWEMCQCDMVKNTAVEEDHCHCKAGVSNIRPAGQMGCFEEKKRQLYFSPVRWTAVPQMYPLVLTIASLLCKQTANFGAEQVASSTANRKLCCPFLYPVTFYLPLLELLAIRPLTHFFSVFDNKIDVFSPVCLGFLECNLISYPNSHWVEASHFQRPEAFQVCLFLF